MTNEEREKIGARIKWLEDRRRTMALKGETLKVAEIEGEITALDWVLIYFKSKSDDTPGTKESI